MPKNPKMRLKESTKKINPRDFWKVKDREEMKEESDRKKEK